MDVTDNVISIRFEHGDTVNLPVGKFLWDIKFYQNPIIDEGEIVSGTEVDSYYAAFTMPECEVRQTGDNLLTADDAPGSTLTPQQINAINAALFALSEAVEKTETNVLHYPTIINGEWNVWDANLTDYTTTGIEATGNGIASIEKTNTQGLVDTYTVNFTDGTTFLYNIRNGSGISSITKQSTSGLVDTYVIVYTDGNSTSFTVTNGATPNISIGVVQEGPVATASITGSAANPVLNLTLPNANVPTKVSELENDTGYLTIETDPTVPAWAKAAQKPTYTATEVGALPSNTHIPNTTAELINDAGFITSADLPTKVSDLTNDAGYLTSHQDISGKANSADLATVATSGSYNDLLNKPFIPSAVSDLEDDSGHYTKPANGIPASDLEETYLTSFTEIDPTIPQWAKQSTKPTYTAQEVGALPNDTYIPEKTSDLINDSNYAVDANYIHTDNNYTTAEKNKLSSIAAGAEVNVNADWNAVSGDAQILNKPTKLSAFLNDEGYLTEHQDISGKQDKLTFDNIPTQNSTNPVTSGGIYNAIANINTMNIHICAQGEYNAETGVPTIQSPNTQTFYLVPSGEGNDMFVEWIYANSKWEIFGGARVDLTDYALKSELPTKVSELNNDSDYLTSYTETDPTVPQWAKESNKPTYTASEVGLGNVANERQYSANNPNPSDSTKQDQFVASGILKGDGSGNISAAAVGTDYGTYSKPSNGIPAADIADGVIPEVPVQDVQINGTSILQDGVANVPIAGINLGVVKIDGGYGVTSNTAGRLYIAAATDNTIKSGSDPFQPVVPVRQHVATFYGFAKAAGDTTQSQSDNAVGAYTDTAKSKIQTMLGIDNLIAPVETDYIADKAYAIGELFLLDGKLYKATDAIALDYAIVPDTNCVETNVSEVAVRDVQVNGTSVVSNGVANVPIASASSPGVAKVTNYTHGLQVDDGTLKTYRPTPAQIKAGTDYYRVIVPANQHESAFYGLAKAAGDTTQSSSSNAVGTYTDSAKASIKAMLGIIDGSTGTVDVTGTTPTITAVENTRYVCGEVATLTITPPASGICIIRFNSGTTATVLTTTGVVWPDWFDATELEASRVYEICITDGYGAVMSWAL